MPCRVMRSVQTNRLEAAPRWIDILFAGLVTYVAICALWMLTGLGGEKIRHYVGLLADAPALFVAVIIAVMAARRLPPGAPRAAWRCLSAALALYLVGESIGVNAW